MISNNRVSAANEISVSSLKRELWASDAERRQTLAVRVRDIIMERQLLCCLERIRYKLGCYESSGMPYHERPYIHALRELECALKALLALEGSSL